MTDLVGFFVADEMEDLLITIDECLDASDCEHKELPAGGHIMVESCDCYPPSPWGR